MDTPSIIMVAALALAALIWLVPPLWVLLSSRASGAAKFGWFVLTIFFSWVALAVFLIVTQSPAARAQAVAFRRREPGLKGPERSRDEQP